MRLFRAFAKQAKAKDFLPKSSNPIIIRLLETEPIAARLSKGTQVYPRKKLPFDKHDNKFQEIFKQSYNTETEASYTFYKLLNYSPAALYLAVIFLRLDLLSPLHWGIESALIAAGYFGNKYIRSEKAKSCKHLLVSANFEELLFGVEDMGTKENTKEETKKEAEQPKAEDSKLREGLKYKRVKLEEVVWVGYRRGWQRIRKGEDVGEVERESVEEAKDPFAVSDIFTDVVKHLTKKTRFLLTIIYYDRNSRSYQELEINPNFNELADVEDYLQALVEKNKLRFFVN